MKATLMRRPQRTEVPQKTARGIKMEKEKMKWTWEQKNIVLYLGDVPLLKAEAYAEDASGRIIRTKTAELIGTNTEQREMSLIFREENGLVLTERLGLTGEGAYAQCILSDADGREVETNDMVPLSISSAGDGSLDLWGSLRSRMLLVPYDNDMWARYEAAPLEPGRKSADLTVLYSEQTREGLLCGAMDFDVWKNSVNCSGFDARVLEACCGARASGDWTHDQEQHGAVRGTDIASSRFIILFGEDWRDLLEKYAKILNAENKPRMWDGGVPFGLNTYAGMARTLTPEKLRVCSNFIYELMGKSFRNDETTFINVDGGWQRMVGEDELLSLRKELERRGQRTGVYDAPFAFFSRTPEEDIPGMPGHKFAEILLRGSDGKYLPVVDGAIPYDLTHPLWQEWTRRKLRRWVKDGFDYLKIDFLSHGGMEGCHYDKTVTTGREALKIGFELINEELSVEKTLKPFFLSLSIAPLFPYGYGNARRFSCDAFGTSEDVEYVLNAQTYSWWTNHLLYQFNDPDHTVLFQSFGMKKPGTEGEARARYTASAISGAVMLLSDDYSTEEARERVRKLATNAEINRIAASHIAFRPVESANSSASKIYTAEIDGDIYVALFNYEERSLALQVSTERAGIPAGTYRDLWSGASVRTISGQFIWNFNNCDAALLKREKCGI